MATGTPSSVRFEREQRPASLPARLFRAAGPTGGRTRGGASFVPCDTPSSPFRSRNERLRLPSAFTVNHGLEGATFRRWLQLERLLQGGRHPAVGVEQVLVGRVLRIDTDEDGPVGLDGNRWLEREVVSGLPHRLPAQVPGKPLSTDNECVRVRALPCDAGQRSTQRKHPVFRTWGTRENGKSESASESQCCCLFVACSGCRTLGVNHFTDSAKNPVIH